MRNPKWWGPQRLQRESAVANFWTNPLNWYLKDSPFRSFFGSNCWTVGCLWVLKGSAVHYHLLVMTVLKIFEATHNTSKCRKMPVSLQRFQHDWHGPALANCPFVQDFCLEVAVNYEEHFHDIIHHDMIFLKWCVFDWLRSLMVFVKCLGVRLCARYISEDCESRNSLWGGGLISSFFSISFYVLPLQRCEASAPLQHIAAFPWPCCVIQLRGLGWSLIDGGGLSGVHWTCWNVSSKFVHPALQRSETSFCRCFA